MLFLPAMPYRAMLKAGQAHEHENILGTRHHWLKWPGGLETDCSRNHSSGKTVGMADEQARKGARR